MNKDQKKMGGGGNVKLWYDNKDITIPEELLANDNLQSILNYETYANEISDDQKQYLMSFIPGESQEDKDALVKDLFDGKISQAFSKECAQLSNPVINACQKIKEGYFCPEQNAVRKCRMHAVKAKHLLTKHSYYQTMLKQLILKDWTKIPNKLSCDATLSPDKPSTSKTATTKKVKVPEKLQKQYHGILGKVRELASKQSGIANVSSDESEDEKEWHGNSKASPCFNYRSIITEHRQRKTAAIAENNKPIDLNTDNITLMDVVNRSFNGVKKASILKSSMLARKRRANDPMNLKKKKLKLSNSKKTNHLKQNATKKIKTPLVAKKPDGQGRNAKARLSSISLFSLMRTVVQSSSNMQTLSEISNQARNCLNDKSKFDFSWFQQFDAHWDDLLVKAVYYLSTKTEDHTQFIQVGHSSNTSSTCKWVGTTDDVTLQKLSEGWLKLNNVTTVRNKIKIDGNNLVDGKGPPTEKLVESTMEERLKYQLQERERYSKPHKAHTYNMHGRSFNVGPVKGMYHEGTIGSKARGHVLLRDDRPSYVTILTLVRDAVAKLPNGEGTRNDICVLLRDSQYLKNDITDTQINSVVSGALDRLHYEKDPCVKYNPKLKLWFYLHGNRTIEELEQLHATNATTVKSKKTTNVDKMKKSTKVLSQDAANIVMMSSVLNHPTNMPNPMGNKVVAPSVQNTWTTIGKPNIIARPTVQMKSQEMPKNVSVNKTMNGGSQSLQAFTSKAIRVMQTPLSRKPHETKTVAYTVRPNMTNTQNASTATTKVVTKFINKTNTTKKYPTSMLKVVQSPNQKNVKLLLRQPDKDIRQPSVKKINTSVTQPRETSVKLVNNGAINQSQQLSLQNKLTQQQIQAEALRKLTEQLSAVSNRPIKIVHQSSLTDADSDVGAHVINIGQGGELTLKMANKSSSSTNGHVKQLSASKNVITVPRVSVKSSLSSANIVIGHKNKMNTISYVQPSQNVSKNGALSNNSLSQFSSNVPLTNAHTATIMTNKTSLNHDSSLTNSIPKSS